MKTKFIRCIPKSMLVKMLLLICLIFANKLQAANSAPELKVVMADNSEQSLIIKKLNIDVKVVGNLAVTTMDMTFTNDFPADKHRYEGTLLFPLAEGQSVNRLAMDFNGNMREGVVVAKEKARVVFEDVERRRVDPALLEMTTSNNYKLRVFPILSKQEKRIIIAYEEVLKSDETSMVYNLPFNYNYNIGDFTLTANVFNDYPVNTSISNQIDNIKFNKDNNAYTTSVHFNDYTANEMFSFTMPLPIDRKEVVCEELSANTYFSINRNVNLPEDIAFTPNRITILWDCSHSSGKRNIQKDMELLKEYFNIIRDCSVELLTFNYKIKNKDNYFISNGDFSELKKKLEAIKYDGGSNFSCINIKEISADAVLLFSDGISSIGNSKPLDSKIPIYTINSNLMCNSFYLSNIANYSGANYINLLSIEIDRAVQLLTNKQYRLISIDFNKSEISEIYPNSTSNLLEDLSIAGIMNSSSSEITLNYGYGNSISTSENISINKDKDNVETGILARIWAKKKLDFLQIDNKKYAKEIFELGQKFNIVTAGTSLLILETGWDYARYNIEAPKSDTALYKEYSIACKSFPKQDSELNTKYNIEQLVKEFDLRKLWYSLNRDSFLLAQKRVNDSIHGEPREGVAAIVGSSTELNNNSVGFQIRSGRSSETAIRMDGVNIANPLSNGFDFSNNSVYPIPSTLAEAETQENNNTASSVSLSAYNSNAEYYKELEASGANFSDVYFLAKEKYGNAIGFYIDVAEILTAKNDKASAAEIITNIAELSQENQEFLRIVAYKLQYLGEIHLGINLFEYIKEIRAEEPQSYRDLALALVDKGQYQRACDLLYELAMKNWNGRFVSINLQAITEMNAIISKYPNKIDTKNYDSRLISAMPLDIRIVLRWDLDNTDIDLWVTDPKKEKCFYSNKNTKIGGLLPKDYTGGYGPEEFLLKSAIKGQYKIECNYYASQAVKMTGGATLFLDLYTNYGKENETKKTIIVRAKENKEVVQIGEYLFE